jgi:tetraacyldisaccharide 4'-kinase
VKARRAWAWPLVPLYAAGLAAKDGLRQAGVLRTQKLKWPVVSVGSLSAGGAGKTPVVIALAELLRGSGWNVDVLSRGYGRSGSGVERVDSYTAEAALRFGDEPVVIAQRARVPVWVGVERFAAGSAAEVVEEGARGVHLLDDGFQHRQLERALDVVVVTAADLEDALLPAGNRREPLAALRRADVVVLREEERERIEARVRGLMHAGAVIWTVRRTAEFPGTSDVLDSKGGVVAFCGIARPADFGDTLRTGGVRVVDSIAFPDHHRYTAENMRQLTESLRSREGRAFLTTEKDAVKLTPELRAQLEAAAPVSVARLQAAFLDPQAVAGELEALLR